MPLPKAHTFVSMSLFSYFVLKNNIIAVYVRWFFSPFFYHFRRLFMKAKIKTRRCVESCWPMRSCAGKPEGAVVAHRSSQCEMKTNVPLTLVASLLVKTWGALLNYNRNLISFLKVGWCDGPWPISVHRMCVCLSKLCVYASLSCTAN